VLENRVEEKLVPEIRMIPAGAISEELLPSDTTDVIVGPMPVWLSLNAWFATTIFPTLVIIP
jgi:hypothetical protein